MTISALPSQLDLFLDSRDVMLRNDAIDALLQRDADKTVAARHALATEDPQHGVLPALDLLIAALATVTDTPWQRPEDAAAARRHVEDALRPAALALLGPQADRWLLPQWCHLAQRARRLPYSPPSAEDHAAALWLRAREPRRCEQAVEGIASWRRIPQPLLWMIQARHASQGLDATWPLLTELAWLSPQRLQPCAQALADPLLTRLLQAFEGDFEADSAQLTDDVEAWFPAWLAHHKPALLPHLRLAQAGQATVPEQGFRLMLELLGLERQGRHAELIAQRKRLRELRPGLYISYMRTR